MGEITRDRRREGEWKVREEKETETKWREAEGIQCGEINTIQQPHVGKFRPNLLLHQSLRRENNHRFKAPFPTL